MKPYLLAAAIAAALLAGCDRDPAGPDASSKAPTTASGGATGASPRSAPAGDTSAQPPAANAGGSSADAKPDPGDANDHSNPQHDAKKGKKTGD
ncbi:MAG: hypothetical protein ACREUN_09470 [Burkholderiales bacterium]